jgi:hypothetical protein
LTTRLSLLGISWILWLNSAKENTFLKEIGFFVATTIITSPAMFPLTLTGGNVTQKDSKSGISFCSQSGLLHGTNALAHVAQGTVRSKTSLGT